MAQVIILIQDKPGGPDGMVNVNICHRGKGHSHAVELGKAVAAWMQDYTTPARLPFPHGGEGSGLRRKGKTK